MGQDSNYVYGSHTALARYAEGTQTNAGLDVYGGQKTSRHLPAYYELAKAGRIYTAQFGVVTNAVASVVDIPTTGAHFALYNGNTAGQGGLNLLILGWGVAQLSGIMGTGAFVVGGVTGAAQASAATTTAGNIIKSTCGSTRTTAATADSTLTLTNQPAWAILGNVNAQTGTSIGFGATNYAVEGMFSVPPGFIFALAVVSPTGTSPAFGASITYAEIEAYQV